MSLAESLGTRLVSPRQRDSTASTCMLESRVENKGLGLADHNEILIGHLYNLIQIRANFWEAIVENCTENGQRPAVIFSSVSGSRLPPCVVPEENVATPQHDACTAEGQVKDVLLNGDTENYSGEQGYTMHTITRDHSKGITVQLNHPYIINCIRMLLWDRDNR